MNVLLRFLPSRAGWHCLLCWCWLAGFGLAQAQAQAQAQGNSIEAVSAHKQGANMVLKLTMKYAPSSPSAAFTIASPARVVLDFNDTVNASGKSNYELNLGDLLGVNLVQAGARLRVVLNLARALNYASAIDGKDLIVTVDGSGGVATAVDAAGLPAAAPLRAPPPSIPGVAQNQLRDIDFRRGGNGDGRIVIDLPNKQVAVDVRRQGKQVQVDILKTALPERLRRRLDVSDFGTPVSSISTTPHGENVRIDIDLNGLWEHSAYQSDTQLVIEVKALKEDPNKLVQGNQGYRGEKLSFNFQNVDIRAVLKALAEISGLNIIASDSVAGNLTLQLKEVPWDQALDVVMQSKGLDMRKNGNVLWIAPREELLTKEKLELEQRAQIADLEPLRSEIFQLNYQKAESFRTVFGLDGGGNDRNRILSKRGSAIIEPRTNQLFITDIAARLDDVRKLIQKTDIATKQVLIEARIVEADDTFSRNLGAKLGFSDMRTVRGGDTGYQLGNSNTRVALGGNYQGIGEATGQAALTSGSYSPNTQFINLPAAGINGSTPGSLAVSLFSSAANRFLNLELSALEADGTGKIISSPRVVTADKVSALIEQGVELPYEVASSSGATTINFRKANLRLEVTPQITPDGNVVLEVDVNKDSVGQETRAGFAINTKHVKTQVIVENGGTVVLGGIYQQTERSSVTKVPLLGDIPLLGYLFRSTGKTNDKTELLVFITPKIVAERLSTR